MAKTVAKTQYSAGKSVGKGGKELGWGAAEGGGLYGLIAFLRANGWAPWDASSDALLIVLLWPVLRGAVKMVRNWAAEHGIKVGAPRTAIGLFLCVAAAVSGGCASVPRAAGPGPGLSDVAWVTEVIVPGMFEAALGESLKVMAQMRSAPRPILDPATGQPVRFKGSGRPMMPVDLVAGLNEHTRDLAALTAMVKALAAKVAAGEAAEDDAPAAGVEDAEEDVVADVVAEPLSEDAEDS